MGDFLVDIVQAVVERKEYFLELMVQHIYLSLTAIAIICTIGISTGIAMLYVSWLRKPLLGVVNFIYTIPSIALFGIFIPLVGIGYLNALLVLVLYGLLPVIRNTFIGLSGVNATLVDAAKGMGATPFQIFIRVQWPLAIPQVFSGVRTMVVMTIALAGLASFIGAGGLGQAIYRGINTNNSSLILAGSILVALLALAFDFFFGIFENYVGLRPKSKSAKVRLIATLGALVILLALSSVPYLYSPKSSRIDTIVVATKPTAEQYILGDIISILIEDRMGVNVSRKFGIGGGTSNIHPAIISGDIDIYPEYTGTSWLFVLKEENSPIDPDTLYNLIRSRYLSDFNLVWLSRFGFSNSFSLAVAESFALTNSISTFSDLSAKSSNHTFGAEFDFFEREDGFRGLNNTYNFNFAKVRELDINLKYQALANGSVDVINAFTTDSRVRQLNLILLEDDRRYFPSYEAGIVVRLETLTRFPQLKLVLQSLNGIIDEEAMQQMNYRVEVLNENPSSVARDFLLSNGLLNDETND